MLLLQLPGEQCSQQTVIHSGAVVSTTRIPVPSSARGYTMYSCCNSCLSSVINKKRLSLLPKLQMPGEQCNQHSEIHSGGVVATAGIAVPSRARSYLLCSCCNCWVSIVINKQQFPPVLLLQLLVKQCNQQAEILYGASVATVG